MDDLQPGEKPTAAQLVEWAQAPPDTDISRRGAGFQVAWARAEERKNRRLSGTPDADRGVMSYTEAGKAWLNNLAVDTTHRRPLQDRETGLLYPMPAPGGTTA